MKRANAKYRLITPVLALTLLALASCNGVPENQSKEDSEPVQLDCLNSVKGTGDLEVTDSVFTPLDDGASYAIEVTNHSDTNTAMVAGIGVIFIDESGDTVRHGGNDEPARDSGVIQYLAPGESQYWAGTWTGDFETAPVDMKVELPYLENSKIAGYTFWWPHDDVEYPAEVNVEKVTMQPEHFDDDGIEFIAHNNSETFYSSASAVIVLRDTQGELVGGQEVGPASPRHFAEIDINPGGSEHKLWHAFHSGFPDGTDTSDIQVQVNNSLPWDELDPACEFYFDAPAAKN